MQNLQQQNLNGRENPTTAHLARTARVALNGRRLLEQGKIIQFVSDLEYEQDDYPVILAGRCYRLRPGFAELAINFRALVVPQYTTLRADGNIHTTIMPAFVLGDGSRGDRIKALVDQYAGFINSSWRIAPESIRWRNIERHFRQPMGEAADDGPSGKG